MKALIFDLDDTLHNQVYPFQRAISSFLTLEEEELTTLYHAFRQRSDQVFVASATGEMSMKEMQIFRMKYALQDIGYTVTDQVAYEIQKVYEKEQGQLTLAAGSQELFAFCQKEGIAIGLITNGPYLHQEQKIRTLGLEKWIDKGPMIISGQVGVMKPSIKIFQMMERRLGLSAEDCCYIGDSFENDVVGAKNAGWKAIWLNSRQCPLPEESIQPDAIVTKLEAVQDWLRIQIYE